MTTAEQAAYDQVLWNPSEMGGPEQALGIEPITTDGIRVRVAMRVGPWLVAPDGSVSLGSLGVMVDDALGMTFDRVPVPGMHSVTTELSLDLVRADGWAGPRLVTVGEVLRRDGVAGLARGEVVDGAGGLVATATASFQFVPVASLPSPSLPTPRADSDGGPGSTSGGPDGTGTGTALGRTVTELLGARVVEAGEIRAQVAFPGAGGVNNGAGAVHGGLQFAASELAAVALDGGDGGRSTTSIRIHFVRPAVLGQRVEFTAEVLHRGRSATVSRVTGAGESGKPFSLAVVTRRRTAPPT